jgi:hypothetical protein
MVVKTLLSDSGSKVGPTNKYSNKKRDVALVAQDKIRRSLFHNEAGSLPIVIVIRM